MATQSLNPAGSERATLKHNEPEVRWTGGVPEIWVGAEDETPTRVAGGGGTAAHRLHAAYISVQTGQPTYLTLDGVQSTLTWDGTSAYTTPLPSPLTGRAEPGSSAINVLVPGNSPGIWYKFAVQWDDTTLSIYPTDDAGTATQLAGSIVRVNFPFNLQSVPAA